jgi:predicted Zn-ribbon and HTH transcriptional regulator
MKNVIYVGIIGVCILVAVIVFMKTHGGASGVDALSDSEMTWVTCLECRQGYEMPLKQYFKEVREKTVASTSALPVAAPLTCKQCGKDGIVRAYKCEKCGEVFRVGAVRNDLEDRCPKCKFSAMEAKREANKAKMQQGG